MKYVSASIMTLICVGCWLAGVQASQAATAGKQGAPPIVAKCKDDLAKRLELRAQDIKVVEVKPTTWPNAALGMPKIGMTYAQVQTPGLRIVLQARNTQYMYTTSTSAFRYGGPVPAWFCSMLYIQPKPNDPNLNGDLYQCSLMGTNSACLMSEVADYYPQEKGAIIAKRRTSRSGHDLLYLKADGKAKAVTLCSGLDFADAAIDGTGKRWAGFVKPGLGTSWNVAIGSVVGKTGERQTLSLPDGAWPQRIAWSGENLMILVKEGEKMGCYETSPEAATPEWKGVAFHLFPGLPDYVLNKSETLVIEQVPDSVKPAVEVATVWFTGDRKPIARIDDFTMRGSDFLIGRYAFVWGEKGSTSAVYTVDIATGEVLPGPSGVGRDIKPFYCPPLRSPIVPGK